MSQRKRTAWIAAVFAGAIILLVASYIAGQTAYQQPAMHTAAGSSGLDVYGSKVEPRMSPDVGAPDGIAGAEPAESADAAVSDEGTERKVIRTAWANLRVTDVREGISEMRALAGRFDAEITELFVQAGQEDGVRPMGPPRGPANATITLRVPADNLDVFIGELSTLGDIIEQNATASDVTEQFIDLSARLENLKAEEARLRQFFDEADNVEELLAVQRELSRARGDIEAMQAQVDHIERQAARATLTVTMTEPGPILHPAGADWGFRDALRRGLLGAVAILTGAITLLITAAPLLVLAVIAWVLVRLIRRRRNGDTHTEATGTNRSAEEPFDDGS